MSAHESFPCVQCKNHGRIQSNGATSRKQQRFSGGPRYRGRRPYSDIRPKNGDLLGIGANRVVGLSWAGEEAVAHVDVSVDGGRTWMRANLMGPQAPYSWTLWEYLWELGEPGNHSLLARTTSASGRTQPMEYDPLYAGYQIDFCRPVTVHVAAATRTYAEIGDLDALLFDINAYTEENTRLPLDVDAQYSAGGGI